MQPFLTLTRRELGSHFLSLTGYVIIATVLLTGAFHEDGLADTCDALGGHVSRERALEIMKDSRIGTFGAIALVLALLMKVGLLAVLAAASPTAVLIAFSRPTM